MRCHIYLLFFIGDLLISEYQCLQIGIVAQYFTNTGVRLDDLASRVRAVFSEHVRVTSSAMCATTCSETEWCSGYLVCKDRPKTLCVLLQVGANSGPATQNTSDYSSCSLYMPSDFRWTTTTTPSSTTTVPSTTVTSATTVTSTTMTSTLSTTTLTSPTTTVTTTTIVLPDFCGDKVVQPSNSNNCTFGLKPGCVDYYRDCQESKDLHDHKDEAVYLIKPDGYREPFKVKCSGIYFRRTHIQQNTFSCCPTSSFNQSWAAYRDGFGDLETFSCNYWLGNKKIAALTAQKQYRLRVFLKTKSPIALGIGSYTRFVVRSEFYGFGMQYDNFILSLKLDDGFTTVNTPNQDLNGAQFYTYDHDNGAKCAASQGSGWWFDAGCARVNLNTDHDPQWYHDGELKTYKEASMELI